MANYTVIRAVPYTSPWLGGVLWALISGGLLIGTGWWLYQNYLFAFDARPASAIVEREFTKVSQGRHGTTTAHYLEYRYVAASTSVDCESSVQADTYTTVSKGASIPIRYLPEEITDNRIELPAEIQNVRMITVGLVVATLVVFVVGAVILRQILQQNKTRQRLLASGLSCRGIVTERLFNLVGKAKTPCYYLVFTFRDNRDQEIRGQTWYFKKREEPLWRSMTSIPVYYDPRDSEVFTVELKPPS